MSDPDAKTTEPSVSELKARLAELEAINAELAQRLDEPTVQIPINELPHKRHRGRGRTITAVALILVATLLTPVAAIGGWARIMLTDTDTFVATYAPLAKDPDVQAYITDQVVTAIEAQVDIPALMDEVTISISGVVDRPLAKTALEMLKQPAIDGVRSAIRNATSRVVASDTFAQVWSESLRLSHSQVVAALQGDPNSLFTLQGNGIGLLLQPLVEEVKRRLVAQGFGLASQIPQINKVIIIASADSLPVIQQGYRLALVVGYWMAPVVLLMFVIAVLVARRRSLATIWAGGGLALGAGLVLAAVSIGRIMLLSSVPVTVVTPKVLGIFYDTVGDPITDVASAGVLLGILVAVVAWIAGPFGPAVKLRTAYSGVRQDLQNLGDKRGIGTGRFGEWLFAHRVGVRLVIGAAALAYLVANRPLTTGMVLGTTTVALVVLLIHSLLQRTPTQQPQAIPAATETEEPTEVLKVD